MKIRHLPIIVFFIMLLLSLACVCATNDTENTLTNNNEYTDSTQSIDSNYINSDDANEVKTYDDLNREINECNDTLELQHDYKYNEKDKVKVININKTRMVINGNNHTIDGSSIASGFSFNLTNIDGSEIIVNNITFTNVEVAFISINTIIKVNNVNFVNNTNPKDYIIDSAMSNIALKNCRFESNNVRGLIGVEYSDISINNTQFVSSNANSSAIDINRGLLNISNCSFVNISSEYGGVTNYKGDAFNIINTTFENVYANITGGVILAKFFTITDINGKILNRGTMNIKNCEFRNVSSRHNGGSIYIDLDSGSKYVPQTLNIINTTFDHSTSEFGGSIIELGGNLNIIDSIFTNCYANHTGGVLYTSYCNMSISNSEFESNTARNESILYFDKGTLKIDNSRFVKNKATSDKPLAIYANDADINIKNSMFENGYTAVYANFATNVEIENNTSPDDFSMNNTDYITYVENKGIKLNISNNSSVVDKLPEKYDYREHGWLTNVKDQGDAMTCWAFATAAAIESSLLKATNVTYDVSADNIQSLQLRYYITGDTRNNETGFAYSGLGHSLSWYGIVMEEDDMYDERGEVSDVVTSDNRIHLQDAMIIFGGQNNTAESIKRAIMTYGPVTIQFLTKFSTYNYHEGPAQPIHFVPIIGWDDTIPAEKFKQNITTKDGDKTIMPPGPGGWIVKDSAGTEYGIDGFNYISYYDTSFLAMDNYAIVGQNAGICYIFNDTSNYHVNYQTDLTGLTGFDNNYTCYSNEFTSQYDEYIGAVGTYFNESGIDYSFDVYVNDQPTLHQSGVSEFAGFKTIKLTRQIPISKEDNFKIIFRSNAVPYQAFSRQHYISNRSLVSNDEKNWIDMASVNKTVCLKVYTIESEDSTNDNIEPSTSDNDYIEVNKNHNKIYESASILNTYKKIKNVYETKNNNVNNKKSTYAIYKNNTQIAQSNTITLEILNNIFNQTFIKGHLLVYIDGKLVFNATVTEDISIVILEILEEYLGVHELKVIFTDSKGNTNTYCENVTIK